MLYLSDRHVGHKVHQHNMDFEGRLRNSNENNDFSTDSHFWVIWKHTCNLYSRKKSKHTNPYQFTNRKHGTGGPTLSSNRPLGRTDLRLFPKLPAGKDRMSGRIGYGMYDKPLVLLQ